MTESAKSVSKKPESKAPEKQKSDTQVTKPKESIKKPKIPLIYFLSNSIEFHIYICINIILLPYLIFEILKYFSIHEDQGPQNFVRKFLITNYFEQDFIFDELYEKN